MEIEKQTSVTQGMKQPRSQGLREDEKPWACGQSLS